MRKYDNEFRENVVKKILDGQSVALVSGELGVAESLLHKWKKAKLETSLDLEKENLELKKKLREVEMEFADNALTATNAKLPVRGSPPKALVVLLVSVITAGPAGTRMSDVQNPAHTWTLIGVGMFTPVIVKLKTLFAKSPVFVAVVRTRLQISKLPVPPFGVGVAIGVGDGLIH